LQRLYYYPEGLFSCLQVDGPIPGGWGKRGRRGRRGGGYVIRGLQPRDKEAMVAKETIKFSHNLYEA